VIAAANSLNAGQFDHAFVRRLHSVAKACAWASTGVGVMVLLGWAFDIHSFKALYGSITMKTNAALALVLAGIGLRGTLARNGLQAPWLYLAVAAPVVVILLGSATLSQHVFGWNLHIDQLLASEPAGAAATMSPNRMGPHASLSFSLCGLAMLLLRSRHVAQAQLLALLALLFALTAIVGYAYGVQELYGVARYTGIALHTAAALAMLSVGLLMVRPQEGLMAVLTARSAGSLLARRLLPVAIVAPVFLGWLRVRGQDLGYFGTAFGASLLVMSLVVILTAFIVRTAAALNRSQEELGGLYESEMRARKEAERAMRSRDEFLATVSHELRTPLNAILGWAHLLRSAGLEREAAARAVETIERNARTQAQLIEDLLDVSRIVAGRLQLEMRDVSLTEVIRAATDAVRPAAQAKQVRLELDLDPLADRVRGDAVRLQQVVWNLLANAVKFTPKDGRVAVSLATAGSSACIVVKDTGEGIPTQFLPYVFDRFQQADASYSRRHGGLGLGLAISRHLVEMHGGTILAVSPGLGKGATFTVSLPLADARLTLGKESSSGAAGGPSLSLAGMKVLVVDDQADTLLMMTSMLESFGATVASAASVQQALQVLSSWRPDVLVSDIGMPGEDGYSLIRKVRALSPSEGGAMPAIALTGYVRVEERLRALSAGFQMFVPKPVNVADLLGAITAVVQARGEGRV
jgi:signal transduction histidine kinase/ActR/RegA family two-component response regulator